jgi:hypothetical protein
MSPVDRRDAIAAAASICDRSYITQQRQRQHQRQPSSIGVTCMLLN